MVWDTKMVAVLLFWDTNMAAVTLSENDLLKGQRQYRSMTDECQMTVYNTVIWHLGFDKNLKAEEESYQLMLIVR